MRRLILLAVLAGITAIAGLFIYGPLLGGGAVALWIPMLIFWITCAVIMILRPPVELSSYRLLLIGVTLVWIVSLACAGPLRTGLMGQQLAEGVLRRDVQITSGVFIAWAGGLLAFAGAVALWARRRDELQAHSRAGQQLAVAAISTAELEEAV